MENKSSSSSSSSTAATNDNDKGEDIPHTSSSNGGHGKKKAKASSSSFSTTATHDNDDDEASAPIQSRLPFTSLPDIVHDAIASFLTTNDLHALMESNQKMLKVYGGKVKAINIPRMDEEDSGDQTRPILTMLLSVLSRRPRLTHITVELDPIVQVAVEAMTGGHLDQLQSLEIKNGRVEPKFTSEICRILADGACPKLNTLTVHDPHGRFVDLLGAVFESRMEEGKGCCHLKSLKVEGSVVSLSTFLSSAGACEMLEELQLKGFELHRSVDKDLSEWLSRTMAIDLSTLILPCISVKVATALCSPDVALGLQTLELGLWDKEDIPCIPLLSQAIGQGSWRDLKRFDLSWGDGSEDGGPAMQQAMTGLIDAISVGAPELTRLTLGNFLIGPDLRVALVRMLRDGGRPRLKELNLTSSKVDDAAVVELVGALEGGAPCNTTLQRLGLDSCGMTAAGVGELCQALGRGAMLPHLQHLNLDDNGDSTDDGVVALAQAMSTGRALRSLQELNMLSVGMTDVGAKALFQALGQDKACPHLKKLSLGGYADRFGDAGTVDLAQAIETGALQQLQELLLSNTGMTNKGLKSLVKAIVAQDQPHPGCPRLEVLDVSDNGGIGDDGVIYLAEMMKVEGAMQHLRVIDLVRNGVSYGESMAFLKVLEDSRVCRRLMKLNMPDALRDDGSKEAVRAVQAKRREDLYCAKLTIT